MANWSEKLNQVTQTAFSKSKEVAGVAKLTLEVNNLKQSIKNIQTEVGAYVLENGLAAEDASVAEWAAKAAALKADMETAAEKINELKNVSICPGCGAEVSRNSKFCNKCGTAIVVKVPGTEETEGVVVDAEFTTAGTEEGGKTCGGAAQAGESQTQKTEEPVEKKEDVVYGCTGHTEKTE